MLSEGDEAYLEGRGFEYEVIPESQMFSLVIRGFRLPVGYQPEVVDLLLRLPGGFPDAAPDMFWTHPIVSYVGGGAPPASDVRLDYNGRTWQRWSRHLALAWRPGVDNLQTYLRLIRTDLEKGAPALAA
ncbi:MAG TPA: E2/UBC family protein [Solirubrobacterales bacterium]|nr:E2/UBC family protein [Solirubrobacterales bacterium]